MVQTAAEWIWQARRRLAETPQTDTRYWAVKRTPCLVVYRVTDEAVEVLRVWHCRRDGMGRGLTDAAAKRWMPSHQPNHASSPNQSIERLVCGEAIEFPPASPAMLARTPPSWRRYPCTRRSAFALNCPSAAASPVGSIGPVPVASHSTQTPVNPASAISRAVDGLLPSPRSQCPTALRSTFSIFAISDCLQRMCKRAVRIRSDKRMVCVLQRTGGGANSGNSWATSCGVNAHVPAAGSLCAIHHALPAQCCGTASDISTPSQTTTPNRRGRTTRNARRLRACQSKRQVSVGGSLTRV